MRERLSTLWRAEHSLAQLLAEAVASSAPVRDWLVDALIAGVRLEVEFLPGKIELRPDVFAAEDGYDFALHGSCGELRIVFLASVAAGFNAERGSLAAEARARARAEADLLAYTVLISVTDDPKHSVAAAARYDCVIPLSRLRGVFEADAAGRSGELGARLKFQRRLMEYDERVIRDWIAGGSARPKTFRECYLDFVEDVDAVLSVNAARVATDDPAPRMIAFDIDTLPRWGFMPPVRLAHHLHKGLVTILIEGWGEEIEALAGLMEPTFDGTGYKLAVAPSRLPGEAAGLLVVAETTPLDPDAPFDGQREAAYDAVQAALKLRRWYLARKSVARYWAEQADPTRSQADDRVLRHLDLD